MKLSASERGISMSTEVFKDLIQKNPDVCSNCFTRQWDRYEVNFYQGPERVYPIRDSIAPLVSDELYPTPELEPAYDEHGRTFACPCGTLDPWAKSRPVSKKKLIEYVHNLCDTLDKLDVEYDKDRLYDAVREMKEDPEMQHQDDDIIGQALEIAII